MTPIYSIIPYRAGLDARLQGATLRLLNLLGGHANSAGWCFPSQYTLATLLNISQQAVSKQIRNLHRLGYIEVYYRVNGQGQKTNCIYRVMHDDFKSGDMSGLPDTFKASELQILPLPAVSEGDTPQPPGCGLDTDNPQVVPPQPTTSELLLNTPQVVATPSQKVNPHNFQVVPPQPPGCSPTTPRLLPHNSQVVITTQLTSQLTDSESNKQEVVNLPRAREEAAADFSDDSRETPDDPFGDTLWITTPDAPETPEEVICQAILPGTKPDQVQYPETIAEARNHPDIQIYRRVTGSLPLASNFRVVVDAIQFLRESCPTDDSLVKYLTPFWQKWKSSKRKDGQPYNPNKPAWLTDWAVTSANSNPASGGSDEEGRYSYSVISNPTPAQYARAATVVFEEL